MLSNEPFRMDAVGLSVQLPVGSVVSSNRVGGRMTAAITPESSTWLINIQTPIHEKMTLKQATDEIFNLIRGSYAVVADKEQTTFYDNSTYAKLIERTDDLKLAGGEAARLYVSVPQGDSKTRMVKGYTVFKPQASQFVVFEFSCFEQDFAKLRGTYETIVGTARFENADALMLERGAAVKAGVALINGLTAEDYKAAMGGPNAGKEQWCRLYRAGKSGLPMDDQECGYRGLKFWVGKRGEINPGKPRSSWTKSDDQDGYLAQHRSRIIYDGKFADTMAVYFMTPDRSEECWTIVTSVKQMDGKEISSATETGARVKDEMTIAKTAPKRPPVSARPPIMGEGYISQFESILLPRLIVQRKALTDLGFYWWQDYGSSENGSISFHKCSLTSNGALLTLTNTMGDGSPSQTATYNEKGELVRIDLPDGLIWEPTDLAALKHLWQQKNLPVDR